MRYSTIPIVVGLVLLIGCAGGGKAVDSTPPPTPGVGAAVNASVLNSAQDEFAPVIFGDGASVLITSTRSQEERSRVLSPEFLYGEAVYAVARATAANVSSGAPEAAAPRKELALDRAGEWTAATLFHPPVLDRVNTGAVAIDANAGRLYVSGTYRMTGDGGADLYELPWPAVTSGEAVSVAALNSPWWDAHPAVSPDGRTIIFASDRIAAVPSVSDTGRRAPRLWIAQREGGTWSAPTPLPAPVNSGTAEISPHFGADGFLYFATKRWPGAGFEIVRSRPLTEGWSQPERLGAPYNSPSDDAFPYLSADRMQLLFASNRPGGAGGYDIWFAEMKYCVPLEVIVRLTDAGGEAMRAVPGADIALEVVATATGEVVVKDITGIDGKMEMQCLDVGTSYTVRPASKSCYQDFGGAEFTTPMPDNIGEGVRIAIDLRRLALPAFHVVTDSIPFFVTGYWYPNTTAELARLRGRIAGGRELPTANFIDTSDYDYDAAAMRVDRWFDDLYAAIDRMLVPMLDSCYGAADTLIIFVQGHVDPRGLAWGKFDEKEEVRTLSEVIAPGTIMQRQEGNVKLSHLRAYYAMRMIDRAMDRRSARYQFLRGQQRVRYQCDGGYIGFGESGSTAGPENDPLKRKFTVTVEIRSAGG
jgi:hypothetical protein